MLALAVLPAAGKLLGGLIVGFMAVSRRTLSLARLADAGHMLSDAGALALSLFAIWIAQKPPTPGHACGYYRGEILAALINSATLVTISMYVFYEAHQRIGAPPEVAGGRIMGIAVGGLLINLAGSGS